MSAAEKKRYYNRVRRTCLRHNLDIVYDGPLHGYRAMEIRHSNGQLLFADRATTDDPLRIDWKRVYNEMTDYGYKCRDYARTDA
jgi:hypothetical protein